MPEGETPKQDLAAPVAARLAGGTAAAQPVSADLVAAYLRRHPDFLAQHVDLLDVLTPPARDRGQGVIDLQQVMVERLRRENAELNDLRNDLVATAPRHPALQSRVHHAILALPRPARSDEFPETTTTHPAVVPAP